MEDNTDVQFALSKDYVSNGLKRFGAQIVPLTSDAAGQYWCGTEGENFPPINSNVIELDFSESPISQVDIQFSTNTTVLGTSAFELACVISNFTSLLGRSYYIRYYLSRFTLSDERNYTEIGYYRADRKNDHKCIL